VRDGDWERIKGGDEGCAVIAAEEEKERCVGEGTRGVKSKVQRKRLLGEGRLSVISRKKVRIFGGV